MSYTTTVRAYENIPFQYRLKKAGYYDVVGTTTGGTSVSETMWVYGGLNMSYEQLSGSPMVVKANAGQLPDLTHISGVTGCLKEAGQQYPAKILGANYTLIGSPTIDSDKVVSNFSNSNYLNVDETVPSSYTNMDIIFKANFTSLTSHNCLLGIQSSSRNWFGTRNTGYFATYSGSWVTGTTVLSTGTDYWFRVINNGTTSTGYLLVDDNYTLDTLPDISQWSQEWTTTNYNIKNQKLRVGYNGTSGEYCSGSIDLKGCNINIDGNDFWNPLVINTVADGLLPSGVTDDGSAQTWNLFYNNGDYLLNTTSTMTGYTWVGSVAIPSHTV